MQTSLSLMQLAQDEHFTSARLRRYYNRAPHEIEVALEPFGYYQPSIRNDLSKDGQTWRVRIVIDPGVRTHISDVNIELMGEGRDDENLSRRLSQQPALAVGDPLNHAVYTAAKNDLLKYLISLGYLDAQFTDHRLEVDVAHAQARILWKISTGQRYELGEVTFHGSTLKPALLHAYVPFTPGTSYQPGLLLELQRALEDSDYFDRVRVDADKTQAAGRRIPVHVYLDPRRPNKYIAGLGFGTDTGPRARLGWANRQLNSAGHQTQIDYRVSEIQESYNGRYQIPLARPRTDFLELHAQFARESIDDAESQRRTLSLSQSTLQGRWRRVLSLTYQQEDFEIGLTDDDTTVFSPGINLVRVWGRERLIAEKGARLQLDIKGAHQQFLSEVSYLQARLDAKVIRPLGKDLRVLVRGGIGALYTSDFDALPPSLRFFAGGDHSVRGYDYQHLGPTDNSGEVIGGRYLLLGSLELERRLSPSWRAAVFIDVGNAINSFDDELEQGAGIGLRWQTPIGLVRIDLANAISAEGTPWRLHLTVGPDL